MRALMRSAVAGAVAGGAATLAMSAVLVGGQRAGLFRAHPPELVVKQATDPPGPAPTLEPREQERAWPVVHINLGTSLGVAYALARPHLPAGMTAPAGGAALGLALWLLNYGALAPSLGLLPSPPRDDGGRQVTNVLAHVVYGATLAAILRRTDR